MHICAYRYSLDRYYCNCFINLSVTCLRLYYTANLSLMSCVCCLTLHFASFFLQQPLQYVLNMHPEHRLQLHGNKRACVWDKQTCEEAAKHGHLHVLRWAHENGCKWTEKTWTKAAEGGYMHICKYIYYRILL
jgi:hypothetical protein